jgi:hypothetical protein
MTRLSVHVAQPLRLRGTKGQAREIVVFGANLLNTILRSYRRARLIA